MLQVADEITQFNAFYTTLHTTLEAHCGKTFLTRGCVGDTVYCRLDDVHPPTRDDSPGLKESF